MIKRFPLPSISYSLSTVLVLLGLTTATYAQTITTFDPPNSSMTVAVAINLRGEIAGYYTDASNLPFPMQKGFIRERNGSLTIFEAAPSATWVTDINFQGELIGYFADPGQITTSGFVRHEDGTIVAFKGGPTASPSLARPATLAAKLLPCDRDCIDGAGAFAINARGEITGETGNSSYLGFLREPNGSTINFTATSGNLVTAPQAINVFGQITGFYRAPFPDQGFLRQPNGTIITFNVANATSTWAQSINLFSQIAGYFSDANGIVHGFVRHPNGKIVTFDPSGSTGTEAESINLEGEVTGFYLTADGKSHGFVRKANGHIETFDVPEAAGAGTFPKKINDRGEIVGYYEDGNSILHGFVRSGR